VTRGRRALRQEEEDMAKKDHDIFICKIKEGDYWAYPSPFIAHGGSVEIHFRNLTDDAIEIDLGDAPVHKKVLPLAPRAADYVIVNGDATPGLYEYVAEVTPDRKRSSVSSVARRRARPKKRGVVLVKGGSPPRIIIDT
jgi:hypothetical protein